ncbi:IS3 family transposase [Patescibacteria group bacterium]|nr:IS3 family transposase [Patescibacteria group bacterium]
MSHDIRDEIVDFVSAWSEKSRISVSSFIRWLGISSSKFYHWRKRYGKVNEHNGKIPRDFWLEDWEVDAIKLYYRANPDDGYRRLTYMMLDANIVAASPSTVYRVLKGAGFLKRWAKKKSLKGTGFSGPSASHEHWHIDISYLNICGTFYYLCSILDGFSRLVVHWEIRQAMKESDVEIILQRALEKYSGVAPRIISDNGPVFIAKDFKEFIRIMGMTHARTSVNYPQSNGKKERWFRTLKSECIRPKTPLSLEDARRIVGEFVVYYNTRRLHSAIGYITPDDKLHGREILIFKERDTKLEAAREQRKQNRKRNRKDKVDQTKYSEISDQQFTLIPSKKEQTLVTN